MDKPYSPSCDRNKQPILEVLQSLFPSEPKYLLEVGSGTGQHAAFLAAKLKNLIWQTSDVRSNHPGIEAWISEVKNCQLEKPLDYEVGVSEFPAGNFDIVLTINTLHIMSWDLVKEFFEDLGMHLKINADFIAYGPFNYGEEFTSVSNQSFDQWLKAQSPLRGIRDFERVVAELKTQGLELQRDFEMPANNRLLHFTKVKNIK